jgi:hypothetical protein
MMTGVEIWGSEEGWKKIGKVKEVFCKSIFVVLSTSINAACQRIRMDK